MIRKFEKFMEGPFISTKDRLHVTINNRGCIQFNRRFYEALGKPRSVVLYYDKAANVIGMSSAYPQLREAFPVNERQTYYFTVNAIPFCRNFGIKVDGTYAFSDPELDNDGIMHLDLRRTRRIRCGGGPKKRNAGGGQ